MRVECISGFFRRDDGLFSWYMVVRVSCGMIFFRGFEVYDSVPVWVDLWARQEVLGELHTYSSTVDTVIPCLLSTGVQLVCRYGSERCYSY